MVLCLYDPWLSESDSFTSLSVVAKIELFSIWCYWHVKGKFQLFNFRQRIKTLDLFNVKKRETTFLFTNSISYLKFIL